MIVFRCVRCGEQLESPASLGGQVIDCPKCGNSSLVPGARGATQPARCSRLLYVLLGLFLGWLGVHNFVAGYNGRGIAQLLITLFTFWLVFPLLIVSVWVIVEIIVTTHDAQGVRMQ